MKKFTFDYQPTLKLLSESDIVRIYEKAVDVLGDLGVEVHSAGVLDLLGQHGARIDPAKRRAFLPASLVEESVKSTPAVMLYSVDGTERFPLEGRKVNFFPASSAIKFLDDDNETVRYPTARDMYTYGYLVETLKHVDFHSTCLSIGGVPLEFADVLRYYAIAQVARKPIVSSAYSVESLGNILELAECLSEDPRQVYEKPFLAFTQCPSPPLKWSEVIADNLVECSKRGIPVILVSMPLVGATSPATLTGAVMQHAAETLSGIVISQCARKGAPVVYGGAPALFDMRTGTAPFGAMETLMLDIAFGQVGKYLGLPIRATMGASDSKTVDAQASWEAAMGFTLAYMGGIDLVHGVGMLDLDSCQSFLKLVMDDELIAMVRRLEEGINTGDDTFGVDVIRGGDFIGSEHTFKWFKKEQMFPSLLVDRLVRDGWMKQGKKDFPTRCRERLGELKEGMPDGTEQEPRLRGKLMEIIARRGLDVTPDF